jgi:hypothetical protein
MERTTQRWLVILIVVAALYVGLLLSQSLLGLKVVPW